jgi:hypothetical protein
VIDDSLKAFIYRQKPMPKHDQEEIMLGSMIDIWLTLDSLKVPDEDNTNNNSLEEPNQDDI